MDLHCKRCKFFEMTDGVRRLLGICHRYPPALGSGGQEAVGLFPAVDGDFDWCGEHSSLPPRGAVELKTIRNSIEGFLGDGS